MVKARMGGKGERMKVKLHTVEFPHPLHWRGILRNV